MKTIGQFVTAEEAHLVRSRLEGAGIPAFIHGENFVSLNWLYSNAVGGVRVQVADVDEEVAQEFLAVSSPAADEDAAGETAEPGATEVETEVEPAETVPCPACGSLYTEPDPFHRRLALLGILFLRFPLPVIIRGHWQCAGCGHKFKVQKQRRKGEAGSPAR